MLATAAATAVGMVVMAPPAVAEGEVLGTGNPNAIEGSYIVVFKDGAVGTQGVGALAADLAEAHDAEVVHTYQHALNGFAGAMSAKSAARLAAHPDVAYVEQDGTVSLSDTQPNPPSWGLDRVDQRDLPLDDSYTYPNNGSGVTAYIIDTGIRTTHNDFGGRATWGTNTVDSNNTDCNGHGTHVAGTTGGSSYGVAKGVDLVAVKVLNCSGSGSFAGVAAGIDWVTGDHTSGPAVANMSLGGSGSNTTVENAVRNSIADGVVYSIASGNSNSDACNFTPARVAEAITVNASTSTDARASFSNWGTCTDIFAPGQNITSAWHTSDSATNTISGTSMAAPHVAGGAALILGASPGLTPAGVADAMIDAATPNKISNPGSGSPNELLFVNTGGGQPGDPVVSNPGAQTSTVGVADSLQMSASGGSAPYTWSATGLPPGMSINASTGLISGTPSAVYDGKVTVTATDSADNTGVASFGWTVTEEGGGDCSSPGQKLANPGFESGTSGWSNATWTIYRWGGTGTPRSGSYSSWISGYGYTDTETLQQTVTIPEGCTDSTLSVWLKIVSSDSTTTPYDYFTIRAGSTVLGQYSNVDESPYTLRTFDVGDFAGQTVTISFTGTEDFIFQTSFVIDDLSLNAA